MEPFKADVGLVVALEEEFTVLLWALGMREELVGHPFALNHKPHSTLGLYRLYGTDNTPMPSLCMALANEMGMTDAIFASQHLHARFAPNVLISVGISGGLSKDVKLGDIVIATIAEDYLHRAKAIDKPGGTGFDLSLAGDEVHFDETWLNAALVTKRTDRLAYADWIERCASYRDQTLPNAADLIRTELLRESAELHHGVTACGPIVGASQEFVAFLLKHHRNYLTLDLESYGVGRAAKEAHCPALSIRAVSDFSDHRKNDLESTYKGQLRKIALQSVGSFLRLMFQQYSRLGQLNTQSRSSVPDWPAPLRDLQKTSSAFLQSRLRSNNSIPADEQPGTSKETDNYAIPHFFTQRVTAIRREIEGGPSASSVIIRGAMGSGKSFLLRRVYQEMSNAFRMGETAYFPVYIDLKKYDSALFLSEGSAEAALTQFQADIHALTERNAGEYGAPLIVCIDSVDYHAPHRAALEDYLYSALQGIEGASTVVAIGHDGTLDDRLIPWTSGRPLTIDVHPVAVGTADSNEVIELVVVDRTSRRPVQVSDIHKAIEHFDIREIDYLTVLKLVDKIGDLSFKTQPSISDFYRVLCEEYINAHFGRSSDITLSRVAEIAHQEFIRLIPYRERGQHAGAVWKLLHYHSTVQNFLVAHHVIEVLRAIGKHDFSRLDHLNYVFPERIDKLCKGIMWHDQRIERECVEGATVLHAKFRRRHSAYITAMTHASYLLGRVRHSDLRHRATLLLRQWKDEADRKNSRASVPGNVPLARWLLYVRTLYISLAYLGDQATAEDYVQKLINRIDWDDLNRGFHLEYYHDRPYLPDENQLAHEDDLEPFPRTFSMLVHRIEKSLNGQVSPAFQIEWFTLLSLSQQRHAVNRFPDDTKRTLRELIARVGTLAMCAPLREYTEMLSKTLEVRYPVVRIVEELYRLKRVKRIGYLSQGKDDAESVTDHSFGAMLLAELFLPEEPGTNKELARGYDKQEILRMLLIHDLAEAFTGDKLPGEHSSEEEERHFRYLAMAGTYRRLSGLRHVRDRWWSFEKSDDINALIARDIDKIENQLQLLIYVRSEGWAISREVLERWERDLGELVKTSIGREILSMVREGFT